MHFRAAGLTNGGGWSSPGPTFEGASGATSRWSSSQALRGEWVAKVLQFSREICGAGKGAWVVAGQCSRHLVRPRLSDVSCGMLCLNVLWPPACGG